MNPLAPELETPELETPEQFIAAMAHAATGVSVVATWGPAGRIARTVSAFASISAEPPIVMVSVKDTSPLSMQIQKNGVFSLNILAGDQHPVANLFGRSSTTPAEQVFSQAEWTGNGSGRHVCLQGAAAAFSCRVSQSLRMGTHRLFFGLVEQAIEGTAEALIYHARDYARPSRF